MSRLTRELHNWLRDGIAAHVLATALLPDAARTGMLRAFGYNIGRARVSAGCYFGDRRLVVGDNVYIGPGVYFDGSDQVALSDGVRVGPFVRFLTSTHSIGGPAARAGTASHAPISVGVGSWIGAGAIILPGVAIGDGTIVAAGSVVTGDCQSDGLYAGAPAILKRVLEG